MKATRPQALEVGPSEEETIESSKYVPARPVRLFEEERFIFPQSYGVNRARLLVKDPDWLFAYWDVDPRSLDDLRATLGERVVALSRITLRVQDPAHGGGVVILVPAGARSWYVRTDAERRAYRAELGMTLPSGEFRRLALSNVVVVPPRGPSAQRARSVMAWTHGAGVSALQGSVASVAEHTAVAPGPWQPPERVSAPEGPTASAPASGHAAGTLPLGGASDVHNRH